MQERPTFTQAELTRVLKAARAAGYEVHVQPGRVRLVTQQPAEDDDDVGAVIARHFRAKQA